MQGSLSQKVGRLTADLIRHPEYIRRCISHHPFHGRSPLDLEIPWFSYAAIDFLDTFLKPHMVGFEYGSGGSTLFLSRRIKFLYSVEDNPDWYERVCRQLNEKKIADYVDTGIWSKKAIDEAKPRDQGDRIGMYEFAPVS